MDCMHLRAPYNYFVAFQMGPGGISSYSFMSGNEGQYENHR